MYKKIAILIALCSLLLVQTSRAQIMIVEKASYPKNLIKFNPIKMGFSGLNLSYERMLTDYSSLNFRVKGSFYIPFGSRIAGTEIDGGSWSGEFKTSPRYSSIGFDAEYRFYNKNKRGPQGFYAAPYLRVNHYDMKFRGQYIGPLNHVARNVEGRLSMFPTTFGTGVQLGAQWLFKNNFTIDWSFFGLGADLVLFKGKLESTSLTSDYSQMKQDADEYLYSHNYWGSRTSVTGNTLSASTHFITIGLKSGVTISYAF
jgi:hypothetical protein